MTQLLYLEEFNVLDCDARVLSSQLSDDGRTEIVLDQTCFYPRGGGQDWDTGIVKSDRANFLVEEVRLDEAGVVHHIGGMSGAMVAGDTVQCSVDVSRRNVNTRLHSAAHVIDMAVDSLGLRWIPEKGQHYPHLSAIEYSGEWDPDNAEELRGAIEDKANELIQKGSQNTLRFMPVSEMHTVCRHVPENLPSNKPARVVLYGEGFGVPCGGTHVKNITEVGSVLVPKLKAKKGVIRLSYTVPGVN